jgi:hypothetical protein
MFFSQFLKKKMKKKMHTIRSLHDKKPYILPRIKTKIVNSEIKRETIWMDAQGREYIPSKTQKNKFELKYPQKDQFIYDSIHSANLPIYVTDPNPNITELYFYILNHWESIWLCATLILLSWSCLMILLGYYIQSKKQHQIKTHHQNNNNNNNNNNMHINQENQRR